MTIQIVNLWFSVLAESNIENHDFEFLIFNLKFGIKIKWTKTTRTISANINFQILLCHSPMLLFSFRILLFHFEFCCSFFWFYYAIINSFIQFPILSFAFELCYAAFQSYYSIAGGVRTTIAKHHGRYSKSDHLCQDGVEWTSRPRSEYSLITLEI